MQLRINNKSRQSWAKLAGFNFVKSFGRGYKLKVNDLYRYIKGYLYRYIKGLGQIELGGYDTC